MRLTDLSIQQEEITIDELDTDEETQELIKKITKPNQKSTSEFKRYSDELHIEIDAKFLKIF